jgi:glycosyltransferase involved in cell wall biosynthesis
VPDRGIVLVHANAPPVPGGTNVVLARLLGAMAGHHLDVYTDLFWRVRVRRGGELLLNGRYRYFLRLGAVASRWPALRRPIEAVDLPLALAAGVRVALGVGRSEAASILLTPLDAGFSQIATALAARLGRRPYVVLVFDLWEENAYGPFARAVARRLERRILSSAATVVAFSETVAEHYRRKHRVPCELIETPIATPGPLDVSPRAVTGSLEILVAGAIYWAQEDAVRRLLRVAAGIPELRVTIVGDEGGLRARGFHADAFEARLDGSGFQERLRRADIIFVGLSLESAHPDVLLTATPARLPEAMASGRPLLLHVPAGSHAARYARSEDFAEVVDEADDAALERGIRAIASDPERAAQRARRAGQLARDRHDMTVVSAELQQILVRAARRGRRVPSTPPTRRPDPHRDQMR